MANNRSVERAQVSVAETQLARDRGRRLRAPSVPRDIAGDFRPHAGRDLADAVHLLCNLTAVIPA